MALPHAGELDRRIIIKKQQDIPAMGAAVTTNYTEVGKVWAKHSPVGDALFFGTEQVGKNVTDRFIVRYSSAVNEKTVTGACVIEFDGTLYRVRRVSDLEGERQYIMIGAERMGNA